MTSLINSLESRMTLRNTQPKPLLAEVCSTCNGSKLWRAHHATAWLCETCRPPAIKSLVAERKGQVAQVVVADVLEVPESIWPLVVNYFGPACDRCRCAWVIEFVVDDEIRMRCWGCRNELNSELISESFAKNKTPKKKQV